MCDSDRARRRDHAGRSPIEPLGHGPIFVRGLPINSRRRDAGDRCCRVARHRRRRAEPVRDRSRVARPQGRSRGRCGERRAPVRARRARGNAAVARRGRVGDGRRCRGSRSPRCCSASSRARSRARCGRDHHRRARSVRRRDRDAVRRAGRRSGSGDRRGDRAPRGASSRDPRRPTVRRGRRCRSRSSCERWSLRSRSVRPTCFDTSEQFHAYAELLPQLVAARGHVRVLAAGCSSGEVAYTLAILARERLVDAGAVAIHAIDVNPRCTRACGTGRATRGGHAAGDAKGRARTALVPGRRPRARARQRDPHRAVTFCGGQSPRRQRRVDGARSGTS